MIKHVSIVISGKVQKVGFRFAAVDKALELGITGIVQNYRNDKVQIEAEGEVETLKDFLRWCKIGPEGAKVSKLDYKSTEELVNYPDFRAEWFT
jgi:acylphosphatase